jgi:AcrR family transcriptional regulator
MKSDCDARPKRQYRMETRAASAEQTQQRILNAARDLFTHHWLDEVTLDDVARQAGVTVQTVLRRFGSKDGLVTAVGAHLREEVVAQRGQAPVGDVPGAVRNLFDHYEGVGDIVLRALAQEGMFPAVRALTDAGRQFHYAWVGRAFAPYLDQVTGQERERLRAQLISVTDVYIWKLLRRDLGLEREQAELALRGLIDGVV